MANGQLCVDIREEWRDIDVQLASVDLCHKAGELVCVAADEDGHCTNAARGLGHRRGDGAEHDPRRRGPGARAR